MDEFLNKNKVGLPEIQQWVEDKMPDIVKDLTHICRIRSVAETEAVQCPPYGKGCLEVLEEMLHMGEENGFSTRNYDNYVGKISYDTSEQKKVSVYGLIWMWWTKGRAGTMTLCPGGEGRLFYCAGLPG